MREMRIEPIGVIHTPHARPAGTPIQPRMAEGIEGTVEVYEQFAPGLKDLNGFERIWLIYWLDRAPEARLVVRPFMDDTPRGLFACRAPCRPNPIGISCVRLLGVEGAVLRISDVDMLDGTPLLDIKPYAPHFDAFEVGRCGWMDGAQRARMAARGLERPVADGRFEGEGEGGGEGA